MTDGTAGQPQWFKELQKTDWSEIHGAYEPATEFPEQLMAVAFGDESAAMAALNDLSENVNHQGTCYPATGPAVPFLIDALAVQESPLVKTRVVRLLAGIVGGVGLFMEDDTEELLVDENLEEDDESEGVSYHTIAKCVWNGLDVFEELLSHEQDADLRMHTAHLLGLLVELGASRAAEGPPDVFDRAVAALFQRVSTETDDLALGSVALALGRVVAHDARARDPLRQLLGHAGEVASVMAALALVQSDDQERHEVAAAERLVRTMPLSDEIDALLNPVASDRKGGRCFPWVWGRLRFQLCHSLCDWSQGSEQRMEQVLPALLCCVRAANKYTAESDVGPVLRWLWPDRRIEFELVDGRANVKHPELLEPEDITGIRKTVVEACYENRRIWNTSIGNTDLVFIEVGLPTKRAAVRKLLQKSWL